MAIPTKFEASGVLPPGTYQSTFTGLKKSILVLGDGSSTTWDTPWRRELVTNLEILTSQLWRVGMRDIFIDGSFVENKDHPNDIDGYFDTGIIDVNPTSMAKLENQISGLNRFDPYKVWDWDNNSRVSDGSTGKRQLPMWIRYRIELYPHIEGLFSGILDKFGNNLQFPSAFRQSRRGFIEKGIVKIIP